MTCAVVINDSAFSAIIGVSFTAVLALMAWIVKTLSAIQVKVDDNDKRLDRVERFYWERPTQGAIRPAWAVFVVAVVAVAVNVSLFVNWQQTAKRRDDACVRSQELYDGQFVLARFFGEQLGATPGQIEEGLADLSDTLGPRPAC